MRKMSIEQAEQCLTENYATIKAAYINQFGDCDGMPNARLEMIAGTRMIISCHYDGYDDYYDECEDPGCPGCEVCGSKQSWDFELTVTGEMPGGLVVS